MTTTVDDQKKNAAEALESLAAFRGVWQQWSNLLSVRRRTVGWNWDLENNDPPGVPDLGLSERLASLGTELLPALDGLGEEPAISQGALAEIVWLCERSRDNALAESPAEGKYYGPAFDVLEADLRSLSGSANACHDMNFTRPSSHLDWKDPKEPTVLMSFSKAAYLLNAKDGRMVTTMANRGDIAARKIGKQIILDLEDIADLNPTALKEARELT